MADLLGGKSNLEKRKIASYSEIKDIVQALRILGKRIALVSGTYDLLHIGHMRYLEKGKIELARMINCDLEDIVLIVGIDSDEKVRSKKGPSRPVVPEGERLEMLCHVRAVDMVILKPYNEPKWSLIKAVCPDGLVISERTTYSQDEQSELKNNYCKEIIFLESQATTSTTARIRLMAIGDSKSAGENMIDHKEEVILYMPVIHKGYIDFIKKNHLEARVNVLGPDIINDFKPLTKDVRAISPEEAVLALKSLGIKNARTINKQGLSEIMASGKKVIMPADDVSEDIAGQFDREVIFENVFLRWGKKQATKEADIPADRVIPLSEVEKEMALAFKESDKSSDWWRHVGAVVAKNGQVLIAGHNRHLPNEYAPYMNGDARANFSSGVDIDFTTAIHAEPAIVGEAAKNGICLKGSNLYITDFPCLPCAKIVAVAGIKKIYFVNGSYTMMDTYEMLKSHDIEIIRVEDNKLV